MKVKITFRAHENKLIKRATEENTWHRFNGQIARLRGWVLDDEDTSHRATKPPIRQTTEPPNHHQPAEEEAFAMQPSSGKFKIPQMSFECFARFVLYYYDDYSRRKKLWSKKKMWKKIYGRTGKKGSKCQVERGNVLHKLANVIKFYKGMCGTGTLAFNAATEKI